MGHIFQLGRMYAEALGLQVLDENGKLVTVTMGSYGIGVSRAVAGHRRGQQRRARLIWPREITPADVHIVATGKDPAIFEAPPRWPRSSPPVRPRRDLRRPSRRSAPG
jgi:prolyl-tRNA synthetase